jgi:hypothetical protein
MPSDCSAGFDRWIADLETRHLRDMTPAEVARALRALSSTYVGRRARLSGRGAFDTAGKRAAYALYYAPRRFLTTAHVVAALTGPQPVRLTDLGCGTGAAGAAWVCRAGAGSSVTGLDVHPWAVDEARATYRAFGLDGTARRGTAADGAGRRQGRRRAESGPTPAVLLSYVANELTDELRRDLLERLLDAAAAGTQVLVMEPISRRTSPWWPVWVRAFLAAGGRHDEWRLPISPPPVTRALGRAAGLDAVSASGRTLWLGAPAPA